MGIDHEFAPALAKALMAAGLTIPPNGSILLSIADSSKTEAVPMIKSLARSGCVIYATEGTAASVRALGIHVKAVLKRINQGHPNVVDVILDESVDAVINTVTGERETLMDGFQIRRAAVERRIPCFTSLDTARAAVESLANNSSSYNIKSLASYRKGPAKPNL